ncbi:LPD7 domain-containing protein [Paraburkholderia tropica]|uniref:LPD7 domain-containing protein n=1 Tax=Paraburkholderia tropica TaxID=92647 RepID=UPI002AB64454|nr:LPD7 domain-containing protein [Paraburkholderia tropica]
MMDDTATSSGPPADEPVINVIEPDPPPLLDPQGGAGGADRFDQTAADALAARRRREFDAARTRLRDQAIQADAPSRAAAQHPASPPGAPRGSGDAPSMQWVPLGNPPETVKKRYLRAGNQYFLKDAPHQLAFEDIGPYLVTEHNRPDVVESMVDMVRAKAWGRIRVSGHEQFRREVWVQATLLGIEVSGYEPKAVDFARLAEGRRERMTNRIDVTETTAAAQVPAGSTKTQEVKPGVSASPNGQPVKQPLKPDANPQPATGAKIPPAPGELPQTASSRDAASRDAEPEGQERQRYVGELVEHGGAPYQHNPARSDSYYVVYRDAAGADHVVWGVDLERAISEAGAITGERVTLENLGRRWVTVNVPVLDATGKVIGEEEKGVYRNTWQVDVTGRERTQSQVDVPDMPDAPESKAETDKPTPSRHAAAAGRHDRSTALPEERAVQLAVLTTAMRQQGFSERSISRVQQRAQRLLDAFEAEGVAVPRPRVFDPDAPSARSRRPRATQERATAREMERTPSEPAPPGL